MPLQSRYSNLNHLIDNAFQSMCFDELLRQSPEQFTLDTCSSILFKVSMRLRQRNEVTSTVKQLLALTFEHFSNPALISSADINWLAHQDQPANKLAFILYNLGCIIDEVAQKKQSPSTPLPRIAISRVSWLLNQMTHYSLRSKNIGNSLHGLGRLAEHGQLQGSLEDRVLINLLKRLNECRDIDAQAIGNSLYGVGRLAERGQLQGSLEGRILINLLKELNECHDIQAQHISNSLHGLGRLVERGQLQGSLEVRLLNDLLKRLNECREIHAQAISNSLHSLGRLAEHGQLKGNLDARFLSALLKRLNECRDIDAQAIGNSLHGIGRLAVHEQLQGNMEARLLNDLLKKLNECRDIDAQAISNSLHGLGRLAERGQLQGSLETELLSDLLKWINECREIQAQAISNSLHGLGRLAERGQLQGSLEAGPLNDLLKRLNKCREIEAQAIGNSLHGLGRLAEHGLLQGSLVAEPLNDLLKRLNKCGDIDAQAIGNSLHGLGCLAEQGQLQGDLENELLSNLLQRLNECRDTHAQHISNSVHGLGRLAEYGLLQGGLEDELLNNLLRRFNECRDIEAQAIGNSLHGLGRLAEQGLLQSGLEAGLCSNLLKWLNESRDIHAQHFSNSLHGLGRLAKYGLLQGELEAGFLSDLLRQLNECRDIDAQAIGNSLHGLGRLLRHQKETHLIDSRAIASLVTRFFTLDFLRIECDQMLFGLSSLAYHGLNPHHWLNQEQVLVMMNTLLSDSYIHPSRAGVLLHALISFRYQLPELNEVFDRLMNAVESVSARRLPPRILEQLQQDKNARSLAPQWRARVHQYLMPSVVPQRVAPLFFNSHEAVRGQRRSRPETDLELPRKKRALSTRAPELVDSEWDHASRNALFQAISKEDLVEVRRLLDLHDQSMTIGSSMGRKTVTSRARINAPSNSAATAPQSQAEQRVNQFFQETPANAMRRLVSESSSEYFVPLLEACSIHGRFVLAKEHHLNLIIIHLPVDSLSKFITALLCLQLYRDHRALLASLDALTIRFDQNPGEHAAIVTLQMQLINRSLEFHRECRHHHVVARLELYKQRINDNTIVLEDMEEFTPTPLALPVAGKEAPMLVTLPGTIANRLPSKPSPVHPAQPNPSYLYTAEDMDALLRIRLNARPDIQVLAATHLRQDVPGNLIEVLRQAMEHWNNHAIPYTALIPIEVGEHWVGIKLVFDDKKITTMIYFNSMETESSPHRVNIVNLLHSAQLLAARFRSFTNDKELRQTSPFDCGPLLIENMLGDCCYSYWPKPKSHNESKRLIGIIRQKHFDLLAKENPLHFETFKKQDNELTPAVSMQLTRYN